MDIISRIKEILSEEEFKKIVNVDKDILKKIYLSGAIDIMR